MMEKVPRMKATENDQHVQSQFREGTTSTATEVQSIVDVVFSLILSEVVDPMEFWYTKFVSLI